MLVQVKTMGPQSAAKRLSVLEIARPDTEAELRKLQQRRSLALAGFRPGRAPLPLFCRTHRKAVNSHMERVARQNIPDELDRELATAAIPPEFVALGLAANGSFEVQVAWFPLPAVPDPRGQLGSAAGPGSGEPALPSLAAPPLESYLPKVQTPTLAQHQFALGSQIDLHKAARRPGAATSPGAGLGSVPVPTPQIPGGVSLPDAKDGSPPQPGSPAQPGPALPQTPELMATPGGLKGAAGGPRLPGRKPTPPPRTGKKGGGP